MNVAQAERDVFGTFYYRFSNGESGADVFDRVSSFPDTLHRDIAKPDYPPNALIETQFVCSRSISHRSPSSSG